ncbi:MAG: DUF4157 domain-containing protein [Thermoanaerobaculia bacterium]
MSAGRPHEERDGSWEDSWEDRIDRASRFGHHFADVSVHRSAPSAAAPVQTMPATAPAGSPPVAENRTGMPDSLKAGIEKLSGMPMDDVKVHYNSSRPAQLRARAYTQGTEIHVAPGEEQHLAHEAWHVVQQKQGRVRPTMSLKGKGINDDTGLEAEADKMGEKAAQQPASPGPSTPSV